MTGKAGPAVEQLPPEQGRGARPARHAQLVLLNRARHTCATAAREQRRRRVARPPDRLCLGLRAAAAPRRLCLHVEGEDARERALAQPGPQRAARCHLAAVGARRRHGG
eukprot:CAMPEP_0185522222 /NCGR_PEP_ID=MMETSP1366-20130426/82181_1 /TAXON_ID=38817 /ORGANISM="Gephyrocapsa oceanica, Strain RCC1303" /LENGTH=108 /DNA_ID=CAMNT_0028133441 /DNA_START=222 /DNA_END=546 /DNA_ORIENTATION=+